MKDHQFSDGIAIWSMTTVSSGVFTDSSFNPQLFLHGGEYRRTTDICWRRVHVIPLSSPGVRIFLGLQQRQADLKNPIKRKSNFVLSNPRNPDMPITWLQKAGERVRDESQVQDFRPHDLRRTCATRLAEMGVPDAVLKMILNHSLGNDITGVYNQYKYFEERKQALDAWAKRLLMIVTDLKAVGASARAAERLSSTSHSCS